MEKYSLYKDSGVQWLGQIPSHWEMKRFRFLLTENAMLNTDLKERKQLQFRYGDIVQKANQDEDADVLKTIQKYTVVQPGDIMINGLNLNYDFISQRVAQVQEPGVITSAYISLRPAAGVNSKYYTYFMKAMDAQKMFHGMGSGVRLTLAYANLKNMFFPYPTPTEQDAIVDYLDTATAKIDEGISQQQRLIDLLNERKEALIEQAVTKGIIDGSWKTRRLRHVCKFRNGYTPSKNVAAYWDNGTIPWFRMEDIRLHGRKLDVAEQYITDKAVKGDGLFEAGSFILATSATVGEHALLLVNALSNQRFTNLKIDDSLIGELSNEFFFYFLYHIDRKCKEFTNGTTFASVNAEDLKNILVGIPSPEEQEAIVSYLDSKTEGLDQAINLAKNQIDMLQERKQIIINDVVTGKVKVV